MKNKIVLAILLGIVFLVVIGIKMKITMLSKCLPKQIIVCGKYLVFIV